MGVDSPMMQFSVMLCDIVGLLDPPANTWLLDAESERRCCQSGADTRLSRGRRNPKLRPLGATTGDLGVFFDFFGCEKTGTAVAAILTRAVWSVTSVASVAVISSNAGLGKEEVLRLAPVFRNHWRCTHKCCRHFRFFPITTMNSGTQANDDANYKPLDRNHGVGRGLE